MRQSQPCEQRLRQLIGTDLSADEVERLASVDALLRVAAACDRDDAVPTSGDGLDCDRIRGSISAALDGELSELEPARGNLQLVATPATTGFTERRRDDQTHELKLTFGQLALVYMHSRTDKPRTRLLPSEEDRHDTDNDKV